jgi:hypothetical protein
MSERPSSEPEQPDREDEDEQGPGWGPGLQDEDVESARDGEYSPGPNE